MFHMRLLSQLSQCLVFLHVLQLIAIACFFLQQAPITPESNLKDLLQHLWLAQPKPQHYTSYANSDQLVAAFDPMLQRFGNDVAELMDECNTCYTQTIDFVEKWEGKQVPYWPLRHLIELIERHFPFLRRDNKRQRLESDRAGGAPQADVPLLPPLPHLPAAPALVAAVARDTGLDKLIELVHGRRLQEDGEPLALFEPDLTRNPRMELMVSHCRTFSSTATCCSFFLCCSFAVLP